MTIRIPVTSAEAKYKSKCPNCGDLIYEGDMIYLIDDEWVCEDCMEYALS